MRPERRAMAAADDAPAVSIVIPVYNEAAGLDTLHARLVPVLDAGHDVVGTWRENRSDPAVRRMVSAAISRLISASVGVPIRDCGSMLRAYRRDIVDQVVRTAERAPFVPVLAASVAQ